MSSPTVTHRAPRRTRRVAGLAGGLAGGLAMGAILQFGMGVMAPIGALVGLPSPLGGWAVHLTASALFGLAFAWLGDRPFVRDFVSSRAGSIAVGVVYGGFLELLSGGVVLPLVAAAFDVEQLGFRLVPLPGTGEGVVLLVLAGVAHLVYGFVLGAVYAVALDLPATDPEADL